MGAVALFLGAVVEGKFTFASRWNVGWEGGLMFGTLCALFLGVPQALLQWGALFALKRFARLSPRTRAWLVNLPVLVGVVWMLGGRYVRWQPQRIFEEFVQKPAPSSLRIADISGQMFDLPDPKQWGIEFSVSPAEWTKVTNGYVEVPVVPLREPETEPELRKQEEELRAELETFLRKEIRRCGTDLPLQSPFRVLRRTDGRIAERVKEHTLRSDWGDFLFYREDDVGHAFFFRGPIGDDLERLAGL